MMNQQTHWTSESIDLPAATSLNRVVYNSDDTPPTKVYKTMKDPRKIAENLTKGAEEVDEQWRPKENAIKQKYIDPLRVRPRIALAFDCISIVLGTLWLFYFGYGEAFIVSLVITVLLFCSVYSLVRNVSEVAG